MEKNILFQIIKFIIEMFTKNSTSVPNLPTQTTIVPQNDAKEVKETIRIVQKEEIDWNNPKAKVAPRFSVEEALLLPSWGVLHTPSEEEKKAIISVAEKVSAITQELEVALKKKLIIDVHVFMRPEKANVPGSEWNGKNYNRYIYETVVWKKLTPEEKAKKIEPKSPHRTGHAIDFHYVGYEGKEKCAIIRSLLLPLLEKYGLRMEDMDGTWIHLDDLPVVNNRFFKP